MSLPRYPEYKDSGVEWLGEVPAHWEIRRIKDVARIINGYPFDSAQFAPDGGIPLVRIRDIYSRGATEIYWSGESIPSAAIDDGDVLIGMDGDFNVAWWDGGPALLNQRVCCVRARDPSLQRVLYYLLPIPLGRINELTYATTVKHLSSFDVGNSRIADPPPDEVNAIVAFLDRETAKIDALIAEQERLIELLKEKRQAVISHAVTKGLDPDVPMKDSGVEWLREVPAHWVVCAVRRVLLRIEQGWSPECHGRPAEAEEWGVLKAGCVNRGRFNPIENKALPADLDPIPDYEVRGGDLLMSRASGSPDLIGSVAFVTESRPRLMLSDKIFRLHFTERATARFIAAAFNAKHLRMQIEQSISGAEGLANNLPQSSLKAFLLALPTPNEQAEIVSFLDTATAKTDALIAKADEAVSLLRERRAALIAAAVTGQVDVRIYHMDRVEVGV